MNVEQGWDQTNISILEQAYITDRYNDAIQNIEHDENNFVYK